MKPVDLEKLAADPLLEARVRAGVDTVTVRGFVRSVDEQTIALAADPDTDSFVEYPRDSVVAAFRDDDSTETTLVVKADSQVRVVSMTRAPGAGGAGCGTECQSRDGEAKCCCGVGERCRSTLNTCWCEPATRFEGGGGGVSQPVAMARTSGGFGESEPNYGCFAYCEHLVEECLGKGERPREACLELYRECMLGCRVGRGADAFARF